MEDSDLIPQNLQRVQIRLVLLTVIRRKGFSYRVCTVLENRGILNCRGWTVMEFCHFIRGHGKVIYIEKNAKCHYFQGSQTLWKSGKTWKMSFPFYQPGKGQGI